MIPAQHTIQSPNTINQQFQNDGFFVMPETTAPHLPNLSPEKQSLAEQVDTRWDLQHQQAIQQQNISSQQERNTFKEIINSTQELQKELKEEIAFIEQNWNTIDLSELTNGQDIDPMSPLGQKIKNVYIKSLQEINFMMQDAMQNEKNGNSPIQFVEYINQSNYILQNNFASIGVTAPNVWNLLSNINQENIAPQPAEEITPQIFQESSKNSTAVPVQKVEGIAPPESMDFTNFSNTQEYIDFQISRIMYGIHKKDGGIMDYSFIQKTDPAFYEIIRFVKGETNALSQDAFLKMVKKANDASDSKQQEKIEKEVNAINSMDTSTPEKQEKKHKKMGKIIGEDGHKGRGDVLFQIALKEIAKQGIEKAKTQNIGIDAATQNRIMTTAGQEGYKVQNNSVNTNKSLFEAERSGRASIGNLILDQLIRFWGMLTVGANAIMIFKNKGSAESIEAAAPYILGAGAVTYGIADGVINQGFGKMDTPEKMAEHIMLESFKNKNYIPYFADPWEIAFLKQMHIPNAAEKKGLQSQMQALEKSRKKDPDGNKGKTICIADFKEGGALANLMPNEGLYLGADGHQYPKEQFLTIMEREQKKTGRVGANNVMRHDMMEKTISRLGVKDSFVPYFDQLHKLATNEKSPEKIA